jgi:hypothetical protein
LLASISTCEERQTPPARTDGDVVEFRFNV